MPWKPWISGDHKGHYHFFHEHSAKGNPFLSFICELPLKSCTIMLMYIEHYLKLWSFLLYISLFIWSWWQIIWERERAYPTVFIFTSENITNKYISYNSPNDLAYQLWTKNSVWLCKVVLQRLWAEIERQFLCLFWEARILFNFVLVSEIDDSYPFIKV